jgi:NADPH:quinone reductase
MKAAWYEKQGPAREVLTVGDMPDPAPGPGEIRIRIAASGINPGDIKKRQDAFGYGMPYPRVIPHSDGAGQVDQVGDGVSSAWLGKSVWCYGAQSYRPFGTAAEFTVVPAAQVVPLPANVTPEQGACLGIPGITAHRAVHVTGAVRGRTVLVQGLQDRWERAQFNWRVTPEPVLLAQSGRGQRSKQRGSQERTRSF